MRYLTALACVLACGLATLTAPPRSPRPPQAPPAPVVVPDSQDKHDPAGGDPFAPANAAKPAAKRSACDCGDTGKCTCDRAECTCPQCAARDAKKADDDELIYCSDGRWYPRSAWKGGDPWAPVRRATLPAYQPAPTFVPMRSFGGAACSS